MLRAIIILASFVQCFGDPLLVWSESDLQSVLNVPLGAKFNDGQFRSQVLQPVCNDHKVVLFDVQDVKFKDLVQIAGNDNALWPSMKSQLSKAVFEKVFEFKSNSRGVNSQSQRGCDMQHVPISFDMQKEVAAVDVDKRIKKELKAVSDSESKPIVFILRSISGDNQEDEEEENVVRRAAEDEAAVDPETQSAAANPDSGYLSNKCYRLFFDRIEFQPLRPAFKDINSKKVEKRFSVGGWQDDGSSCSGADMKSKKEMTIKLKGTKPSNAQFTNIKVEMVVKAYGKYGNSGKSFKYWYADSMKLTYTYNKEEKVSRISPGYIAAPQDNSYACQRPDNQPWAGATANLIFTNMQFDANMIIDGTEPVMSDKFNDGVDCEARLGKGGIVGLFFIVIVLLTGLYIIAMLSSAKNPVFGDKQIVVNQE